MAKTTFTAIDPAGKPHTRKTDRVYTHTVVVRQSNELAEAAYARYEPGRRKLDAENYVFDKKLSTVEGLRAWYVRKGFDPNAKWVNLPEEAAKHAKALRGCATAEAFVELKAAERRAAFEAEKAAGHFERYLNAGWCGRPDLALKLAAKQQGFAEVRVLEAKAK